MSGQQGGALCISGEQRMHIRTKGDRSLLEERLFTPSLQTDTHQPSWELIVNYLSIA